MDVEFQPCQNRPPLPELGNLRKNVLATLWRMTDFRRFTMLVYEIKLDETYNVSVAYLNEIENGVVC